MAAIANGGSADDIAPGVDFFGELKEAGQLPAGRPDARHDRVGPDPGRHRLGLPQRRARAPSSTPGRWSSPRDAVVAGYYHQAINADAPHPAAARLWQEFLYSDEGQNLWLKGGARPVRADAMAEAGTIDQELYDALPPVEGEPVVPTVEQTETAADVPQRELGQGRRLTDGRTGAEGGAGRLGPAGAGPRAGAASSVYLGDLPAGPDRRRGDRRVPGRRAGSR